jgi:hypothetical protein
MLNKRVDDRCAESLPAIFVRHFRAFRKYTGNHMFAIIGLNLVMSWVEAIGLAMFLRRPCQLQELTQEVSTAVS